MGSGKGKSNRARSVGTRLKSVRDSLHVTKMVFGGAYRISRGELPEGHVETRFHPAEIELLDDYAARNNCSTRSEALLDALRKQSFKLQTRAPLTRQELRATARTNEESGHSEITEELLDNTVILSDELSDADCALVKSYWERTGCQTAFGVPRHAFIAELIDEGILPQSVHPPIRFTPEPIRPRTAAGLLP